MKDSPEYSVARRYTFQASHHLSSAAAPWNRPHSHLYTVEVKASASELDDDGMIVDTDALDAAWERYEIDYGGRNLNESHTFPTTVENLADDLLHRFRDDVGDEVVAVTVWEDDSRWGRAKV